MRIGRRSSLARRIDRTTNSGRSSSLGCDGATGRDVGGPAAGEVSRSGTSVLLSVLPEMRTTGLGGKAPASDRTIPTRRGRCNPGERRGRARLQTGAGGWGENPFSQQGRVEAVAAKGGGGMGAGCEKGFSHQHQNFAPAPPAAGVRGAHAVRSGASHYPSGRLALPVAGAMLPGAIETIVGRRHD